MHKTEYNFEHLGKRVYVTTVPNWLTNAVRQGICLLKPPMTGKIIGSTSLGDKIAVEFDNRIWNTGNAEDAIVNSTHFTTTCNGKGKRGHCAYFMPIHVQKFESNPSMRDGFDKVESCIQNRALLLLIK
jgi:hypothetical protein